jgi:hypothetical protein
MPGSGSGAGSEHAEDKKSFAAEGAEESVFIWFSEDIFFFSVCSASSAVILLFLFRAGIVLRLILLTSDGTFILLSGDLPESHKPQVVL